MAWRFKASKYKNSAPLVPKIEDCVRDLVVGSYQNYGNNIAASGTFMAFPIEHTGSACAAFKLDDSGRKPKTMPVIHAHTDTITDLAFSPFHDNILATGSLDSMLKIWSIPEDGLKESLTNPECTFNHRQRRIENVGFHPIANCLLYSTASTTVHFWDLMTEKEIFSNNDHDDVIQSLSFKADGTVFATNCKDKMVRIIDPRNNVPISNCANSHQSIKDSRVVWLGDQPRILTTGFDSNRMRQVIIRDLRNFSTPEKTLELDVSTGVLMPLFDPDTNMLFLAGKGDNSISFLEVTDKDPYLIEGIRHTGEQTKGACLVPKRSLRVMDAEVNRVLQLTINSVIPIMYQVPRKSYRDFHSDIFPETNSYKSDLLAQDWMDGKNYSLPKMSLDPAKKENKSDANDAFFNSLDQIITNLKTVKTVEKEINGNKNTHTQQPKFMAKEHTPMTEQKYENEFLEKFNSVRMQNHDNDAKVNNNVNNNDIKDDDEKVKKDIPKPLPRKSISEQISFEEIIPKPKPRTSNNCNNYKPRLGPKPFSLDSTDNSFDKVFAVPAVPREIKEAEKEVNDDNKTQLNDQNENNLENEQLDNFARDDEQRKSIADRRKLYENRSQSITEEKKSSPVMKRQESMKNETKNSASEFSTKRTSTVFGKVSKFRHLKGVPAHKSFHIENLRNVSRQIPSESDVFCANHERVAVPISGAGGKIAVFELSKGGRLPDGVIPCLVNGINIMDFQWDPFDSRTLVVACDDGRVKIWTIPEGGLVESTNEPTQEFPAHSEKISIIKFHPLAKNILLTASYDMTMKIWDLSDMSEQICLKGHTDQIYCFAWSPCGKFGATVCKDGKIRIFNPRKSSNPVQEGIGAPIGTRGCRISYALNGDYLVLTGFDKVSERQVYVFKTSNLNDAIGMISLDVSPVILVPYYDEDSSTLFLSGKGDTIIYAYEVTEEAPYLCPLSHHRCPNIHQGLSFITKNHMNVAIVEFAKCYRLTNNSIEPLSFTVPRIKTDYFQDDIFIPTRMLWNSTMTSSEWLEMNDKLPAKVSLKPNDMEALSSLNTKTSSETKVIEVTLHQKSNSAQPWTDDEIKMKQQDLKKSVSDRMAVNYDTLEQDKMEGVDSAEWQD